MASRCTNCGGELQYDIPSGQVKCLHCESTFDPEKFQVNTAAEEYRDKRDGTMQYDATVFVCPNCGAEIYSNELDAVNYCLYCGSFVTLESQLGRVRKPDYIIPFAKTIEDCKAAYRKMVSRHIYAPREFRDENFISGFRGIYIPFWNYEYEYGPNIELKGEKVTREGNYLIKQAYHTKCNASGRVGSAYYDASSNFDDEMSCRVAPYEKREMRSYNPSYMFGFFGDTADIKKEVYAGISDEEMKKELWDTIREAKGVSDGYPLTSPPVTMEKDFQMEKKASLAMMPVWFLTWRKDDRVAYSVMNGSTGNMYGEIPVDIGRYLMFSLLTAVPIFFGLNEIVTFTASEMLLISILLAVVMCILYSFELDKVVRRVMHTDDRGFLATHEDAKWESDEKVSDNFITATWNTLKAEAARLGCFGTIFVLIFTLMACVFTGPMVLPLGLLAVIVGVPLYSFRRVWKNAKILREKGLRNVWLDVSGALFSVVFGVGLLIYDPAPDIDYYIASVICMVGIGIAALRMVKRYNQLITRPLPRFFDRREGGK